MRILIVWLINTVALLVLPYLMTSIRISGFWTALIAALVLGLVNALIRPDSRCVDIACNAGDTGSFHFCHQRFAFLAGFQNGGRFLCQRLLGCDRGSTALQYHFVGIVHFAIEKLNANTKKFQY